MVNPSEFYSKLFTMSLRNKDKRDWAKTLYLSENLTQKEIAGRVGVTEKTMSRWVNDGNWEHLKSSIIMTKSEELKRIYQQLNELNSFILTKTTGQRFASSKEADTISKLASAARSLETEIAIADVIEVFKRFTEWIRKHDFEKAKEIVRLEDQFIQSLLR